MTNSVGESRAVKTNFTETNNYRIKTIPEISRDCFFIQTLFVLMFLCSCVFMLKIILFCGVRGCGPALLKSVCANERSSELFPDIHHQR